MGQDYPRRLLKIVIVLAVVYLLTFLSGFLQDTPFNFFSYIFFSLLLVGGIVLIKVTVKAEVSVITKGILFLIGISTTLLFIFYVSYELLRLKGYEDYAASIEALLYLITLFFWISVIISLVLINRMGRVNSSQS